MASRLALKYGLVSEEDRLSNSSDALVVTEPTTGSKARTKGSLYLIVTSRTIGGRTRDACRLVADVIRREYYYDESAGISIVLEKAIRAANRRLRHAREASGVAPETIGIAVAVVRNNELYVATCGDANSYLIRSARLLMPEHESGGGLPAPDPLQVGVWRGEFAVGDSLVLSSRNLVEVVGTEELKNAVVTLHPQSAVEHLHHLFVAAGGEGSDAVLAIEATEVSLSRVEHRLVPVAPAEPLAGTVDHSPIPLADQVADAANAVRDRASAARVAVREGIAGTIGRVLDIMPRRRAGYRRLRVASNDGETQRRAIVAVAALIIVVAVLGLAIWYLGPFRGETPVDHTSEGQAALTAAADKASQVFGPTDLLHADPTTAATLLQDAWDDLQRAKEGVDPQAWQRVRDQVAGGLDELYGTYELSGTQIYSPPPGTLISGLVSGPDDAAYAIVGSSVVRIDPESGASTPIVTSGEGSGQGIGQPRLLARGGPEDLLILDAAGSLWRWRASGTLGQMRVAGDQAWGADVVDFETFVINPDTGLYRIYVPYPSTSQILRYEPTADGGGFSAPAPYFVGETEDVAAFSQLMIDGDVYAVTAPDVLRYFNGRRLSWTLDDPPDDANLRPGHQYQLIVATGTRGVGQLYVWDKLWSRILVYDKTDGTYVEQYLGAPGQPAFSEISAMYLIDRGQVQPPILVWARPEGIYEVVLTEPSAPEPSPSPSASAGPSASPTSGPSGSPKSAPPSAPPSSSATAEPGSPEPTRRPRRTPPLATASATP